MHKINTDFGLAYRHRGYTIELDGQLANCFGMRWVITAPDGLSWRTGSLKDAQVSIREEVENALVA
jgi:hypothetical protein